MAKINLLPWRQELKKQRQQEFIVINAAVALSAAAIIMFFHLVLSSQLSDQEERKAYIQSEIATLDGQIKQIDDLQQILLSYNVQKLSLHLLKMLKFPN